jgi:outer membrane murein-binding lipoprotein Lpp
MYPECRHIMPRGVKCQSPALKGKFYCYYHEKLHTYTQDGTRVDRSPLCLPSIEDARGIQLALMQIMGSIATRRLDPREGGSLLYGLQLALQALDRVSALPPTELVEMTSCDGIGADISVAAALSEPHAECATCVTSGCINIARQNKQSTRQTLDAELTQREASNSAAAPNVSYPQLPAPVPTIEPTTDRIDKFRTHPPDPEPQFDRKTLDRLAQELRQESNLAVTAG